MNRRIPLISGALVLLVALLTLSACTAPGAGGTQSQPHTISVTGTGVAYGAPDVVTAMIGVESRDRDPAKAVDDANGKMAAILAAIKGVGVDEKDIQTANFSVYAQPDYDENGKPTGTFTYVVNNSVSVTLRALDKVGEVLGESVSAGANSIGSVSFSVSDQTKLESEARDKAMANAKARAEQLAKAAGVTLDKPMSINEYSNGPVPVAMDKVAVGYGGGGASVPVSSGQVQINLQVSVTYLIK